MPLQRLHTHFPDVLPLGTVRTTDTHTFTVIEHDDGSTTTEYVYQLDKAPIERVDDVTGIVQGQTQGFVEGDDFVVVDSNGDGELDAVDFSVGGRSPDANTQFEVTYVAESILSRYVDAHHKSATTLEPRLEELHNSHQIDNATKEDLDRIGALFGDLGKRRNRDDEEYRAFLKSIVQSFRGRGTKPGMRFAIAAGLGLDLTKSKYRDDDGNIDLSDYIIIEEDFEQVGYEIRIETDDTTFLSSAVNDMAELADPSGVALLSPPIIVLDGETALIATTQESTVVDETVGLGGDLLTLDGSSTLG